MNEKGFTLVELILVIGILGIIATISLPKNRASDYKLLTDVETLTNDIRYVRYLMMTKGEYYHLVIQKNKYFMANKTKVIKIVEFDEDILILRNFSGNVLFNYNGSPTRAGTITISNINTKKNYTITIMPATGRVLCKEI